MWRMFLFSMPAHRVPWEMASWVAVTRGRARAGALPPASGWGWSGLVAGPVRTYRPLIRGSSASRSPSPM